MLYQKHTPPEQKFQKFLLEDSLSSQKKKDGPDAQTEISNFSHISKIKKNVVQRLTDGKNLSGKIYCYSERRKYREPLAQVLGIALCSLLTSGERQGNSKPAIITLEK